MADYKSMYYHLVRAQLKAIGMLQKAHIDTEKLFMEFGEPAEGENLEKLEETEQDE